MINFIELSESRLKARLPFPKLGCCWQVLLFTTPLALLMIGLESDRAGKRGEVEGKVSARSNNSRPVNDRALVTDVERD